MESVFKRTSADSSGAIVSANVYNLTIGLVLSWGFFINWLRIEEENQTTTPVFKIFVFNYTKLPRF